jgi:putative holliday junction resolvase
MRYLAVDLGAKRTGIAVGDDETRLVSPVEVITVPHGDLLIQAILKSIERQRPGGLVVGLPTNMDGTEAASAMAVRAFGEALGQRSGLPVDFQDERLTSYAADQRMAQSGRTRKQKKELRDALAAAEILRDYLDAKR